MSDKIEGWWIPPKEKEVAPRWVLGVIGEFVRYSNGGG